MDGRESSAPRTLLWTAACRSWGMAHVSRHGSQRRALGYKGHRWERTAGFLSFLPLFTFYISSSNMSFYFFFPPPLQVLLLPCGKVLSFAQWHDESHGMPLVGGALSPLGCLRSHVRLMYQSPRDSFALWLEQPTIHPNYGRPHHRTYTHSSSLASLNAQTHTRAGRRKHGRAVTHLNSKGDAAVTPALSPGFGVFAPPAMLPDAKLLIKLKPIPLEHSTLPAIFFN